MLFSMNIFREWLTLILIYSMKRLHIEVVQRTWDSFENHDHVHIYDKIIEVPDDVMAKDVLGQFSIEVYECDKRWVGLIDCDQAFI